MRVDLCARRCIRGPRHLSIWVYPFQSHQNGHTHNTRHPYIGRDTASHNDVGHHSITRPRGINTSNCAGTYGERTGSVYNTTVAIAPITNANVMPAPKPELSMIAPAIGGPTSPPIPAPV